MSDLAKSKSTISMIPSLISTTIKHYVIGPPQPSWDLKFYLAFEATKSFCIDCENETIEKAQENTSKPVPPPAGVIINESKIGNKYRYDAQVYIEKILKPYEHVLDTDWKDLKDDGIVADWIQVPNDEWEKRETRKTILYFHGGGYFMCSKSSHSRGITCSLAKEADARVFSIDYRLAPQNQFPSGLQDALAAYLYLLDPPKDAGFEPLNPKNIVISGDSAGGGLSMALSLAIRDAGLPSCAGVVCFSPWVDLTSSTPTIWNDQTIDYIRNPIVFRHMKPSKTQTEFLEKASALTERIKKQDLGPKFWHDSFVTSKPNERRNMYAPNEGLSIPYVSPMLAESLCDLPPLLLIAGGKEILRDEIVYLAHRSAEPDKYKGPSYNVGKFEKSPFKTPTNTTLEVYEEMPHVFQLFVHDNVKLSYKRISEFINRVINTPKESLPPSSYVCINGKSELGPLKEDYKEILKWEKIGIAPSLT